MTEPIPISRAALDIYRQERGDIWADTLVGTRRVVIVEQNKKVKNVSC